MDTQLAQPQSGTPQGQPQTVGGTLGLGKPNASGLTDLNMILSDIHNQLTSLEQKLELVSVNQQTKSDAIAQNSPNSPDHIHSLLTNAGAIRDRLGKLYEELVI